MEDCGITGVELLSQGIPENVVMAVMAITKFPHEEYVDYIARVNKNDLARVVKIADIDHNLSTLGEKDSKQRKDKYKLAKYILEEK